jgi:glucokinase
MQKAIAIDLGGTHASIAIVDDQSILASRHIDLETRGTLATLLPTLHTAALELLSSCALTSQDCLGISLSLPSLVEVSQSNPAGRIVSCNDKYPDATELDLHTWARTTFNLPLSIENDARAALIGEHHIGAAKGALDVLMLTFGTGIGCALLIDGKPFRTAQAQGGNLGGHIPLSINGRQCTCGAIGCMEAEASTWALPFIVRDWPGIAASPLATSPQINFKLLFALADSGDPCARDILHHCIHIWSVGTVGLIHAYGPELVVFGGGMMQRADLILPQLTAYVHRHAWTPSGPVRILPASLGNNAALYAAIPLLQNVLHGESSAL